MRVTVPGMNLQCSLEKLAALLQSIGVAQDALQRIRLALLDDVMPRMGGLAALAQMRQLVPGLPAILSRGYSWSLDGRTRESDEACIVLQRPWQPRELLRRVREGLEEG